MYLSSPGSAGRGGWHHQAVIFHTLETSLFCFQSILLLYGTYLAGLTDNVSSPPVNQSLTLIVGVNLVFLAASTVCLVHRFFRAWHNLLFGFTSGGIFVCTTTINCFIFVPQVGCHVCPTACLETGTGLDIENCSHMAQAAIFLLLSPHV